MCIVGLYHEGHSASWCCPCVEQRLAFSLWFWVSFTADLIFQCMLNQSTDVFLLFLINYTIWLSKRDHYWSKFHVMYICKFANLHDYWQVSSNVVLMAAMPPYWLIHNNIKAVNLSACVGGSVVRREGRTKTSQYALLTWSELNLWWLSENVWLDLYAVVSNSQSIKIIKISRASIM